MLSKRFLSDFSKVFKRYKDSDSNWNERLFESCGKENWADVLSKRSEALRRNFEENEANIRSLEEALGKPLSDREYRNLADAALKIYQDGYDDIRVFTAMLGPAIAYFKSIGDLDYLIPLIHAYCFEYEQVDPEEIGEPLCTYEDVLLYKDGFSNISTRYAKLCFFKSYSNIISRTLNKEEKDSFAKMHALYLEALSLWDDERVQKEFGEDEEFLYFINRMQQTLGLYEHTENLTPEEAKMHKGIIGELMKDEESEVYPIIRSLDVVGKNLEGLVSNEDCAKALLGYFDETFARLDLNEDPNEQQDYIDDCYNIISSLSAYLSGERKVLTLEKEIRGRIEQLRLFMKGLPYSFYNSEMNLYVSILYKELHKYMSFEEKKEYLLETIMFRQPITCIHSLMVERLSLEIAKSLFSHKPSLFIGLPSIKGILDVEGKKEEILRLVRESALFHDVGKISLVDIINTQNRRLCDLEFKKLRTHPENGIDILGSDSDFAPYFDVIKGHHRWYDGKGGYPDSFDPTLSPYRIVIDIITIADCLDAATDTLGRNYSQSKTYQRVLGEFEEGKGTRYNPGIVDIMEKDTSLSNTLSSLTKEGRLEVYGLVYSKYIH